MPDTTASNRIAQIRAREQAATPGPWERYEDYGPNFYAYLRGEHLRGVGDLNFGDGEDAAADRDFVTHARDDVAFLLAQVAELEAVVANSRKLINAWLQTAGEHHSIISTIDAVKENPLIAGMQEGRANQYSDCANELRDVLDGEDPDTWDHRIGIEITVTEPADA